METPTPITITFDYTVTKQDLERMREGVFHPYGGVRSTSLELLSYWFNNLKMDERVINQVGDFIISQLDDN